MTDKDKDIAAGDKAPRPDVTQRKARRRWPHRVWHGCAWALSVLTLITVALAVVVLALRDQPLVAPRWLHDRLEARLDSSMPGLSVQFGEVSVILGDSWKPRLRLRDLQVQCVGSPARVSLSDIEGTIEEVSDDPAIDPDTLVSAPPQTPAGGLDLFELGLI